MTNGQQDTANGAERDSWVVTAGDLQVPRWIGRYLGVSVALFVVGVVLGAGLIRLVDLDSLAQFTSSQSSLFPDQLTFWALLQHNLTALVVALGGVISFGVLSAVSLVFNGFIIGILLGATIGTTSPVVLAALIVPHGILELPAFWLASAIGFRISHRLVRYLRGNDEQVITRAEILEAVVLGLIAVLMIVIAAWIEVNVTPVIAERVGASI